MSNDISVRLTGDNSDFRSMMSESAEQAGHFAGKLTEKVADKVIGLRDVAHAAATALGLNLEKIAEKIARTYSGMSEAEEEAYKKSDQLGTQAADLAIKNMRARLTEEQHYQLAVQERDRIQRDLADSEVKSGKDQEELATKRIALENTIAEIQAYEAKKAAEAQKEYEEMAAKLAAAADKEHQRQLAKLDLHDREKALKNDILALAITIENHSLSILEKKRLETQLEERRQQLATAQDEQEKQALEMRRKAALSLEDELDKFELQRKAAAGLTDDEHARLNLLKLQTEEKKVFVEIEELEKKLVDGTITPAEKDRLHALIKQDQAIRSQIGALKNLITTGTDRTTIEARTADELERQVAAATHLVALADSLNSTKITRIGTLDIPTGLAAEQLRSLEPDVLEEYIARLEETAQLLKQGETGQGPAGRTESGFGLTPFQGTPIAYRQAEGQISALIAQARDVRLQGSSLEGLSRKDALKLFGQDLTQFDSLYSRANVDPTKALSVLQDKQTQTANTLDQINQRLAASGLFPLNGSPGR